jgi:hypothetical protein
MGTTGGDVKAMTQTVFEHKIPALIAPNMGKQIVAMQVRYVFVMPASFKCSESALLSNKNCIFTPRVVQCGIA